MKWRGRRGSANVEDRRMASSRGSSRPTIRMGGLGGGLGGRGGRMPLPRGRAGLFLLLAIIVIGAFLGGGPTGMLDDTGAPGPGAQRALTEAERDAGQFVSVVLADTEEVWADVFRDELGRAYAPPTLVLFAGTTRSACGAATAATGPFYCPADRKVYLDTDFFRVLRTNLGADGDFAQAYVIAHEVGHHVQHELGILAKAHQARATLPAAEANEVSVRTELMADCFAGLWARKAEARFGALEPGDVEEAMNAAAQIGDDALQAGAGGAIRPDTFTHGTSEQRQRWFARGYETGRVDACDTFATDAL